MKQLLGEYDVKVDAKGRLRLPSPLIRQLDGKELNFVVNRGFEECLVLYPQSVWDKITRELNQLNMYVKKNRDFVRYFLRGAAPVTMDGSDRINLPQRLLDYAGIDKEAIVFANLNKIEIWDQSRYDGIWSESPSDDYADLAEEVMGKIDKEE